MVDRVTPTRLISYPARAGTLLIAGAALLALGGCGDSDIQPAQTSTYNQKWETYNQPPKQTVFGDGNPLSNILGIGGGSGKATAAASGIGVNSYLWRASLDTVSFMPIASADPFGGVIITDWYSPPETPDERFKINIFILDRQLHASGLKTTVFRQTRTDGGTWSDAAVDAKTALNLEDSILTRARQMRYASSEVEKQQAQ